MKRILAALLASAALLLITAAPATAAPPPEVTALVTIDDASPAYGQAVILTATISNSGDESTQIRTTCAHAFGQSFGFSNITSADACGDTTFGATPPSISPIE